MYSVYSVENNGIWLLDTQSIRKNVYEVEGINVMTGRREVVSGSQFFYK